MPILNKKKFRNFLLLLVLSAIACFSTTLIYNNVSFSDKQTLTKKLDAAILKSNIWVFSNSREISEVRNIALLRLLIQCNTLKPNKDFEIIINSVLSSKNNHYSICWIRQIAPDWPIDKKSLNKLMSEQDIDYKWILYACAPDLADITPEEVQMLEPDKWQGRKLTHQLYALTLLRENKATNEYDKLIEHLSDRLTRELFFDIAVTDIYIQKVAFVLQAGFPEKINIRWLERIIANQQYDDGWNDRWYCFTSGRRPVFDLKLPPSNQHATLQAINALYLARYKYAKQLKIE